MTKNKILEYFLHKPGTFQDDEKEGIFLNVASKSVCKINESDELIIDLKCNKGISKVIQNKYDIKPGDVDGDFQWNQIRIDSKITDNEVFDLIDNSYESMLDYLPNEEKKEIFDLEW